MKNISELTVKETIALLERSSEQVAKMVYTRGGLIMHLAVLYHTTGAFVSSDTKGHELAKNFLEFLLCEGSAEDKRLVGAAYMP